MSYLPVAKVKIKALLNNPNFLGIKDSTAESITLSFKNDECTVDKFGKVKWINPLTNFEDGSDLFMEPIKLSGFINIYTNKMHVEGIYPTRYIADDTARGALNLLGEVRVACIDLSNYSIGAGLA
jgi:hypothetical protein